MSFYYTRNLLEIQAANPQKQEKGDGSVFHAQFRISQEKEREKK
jgi:hypothetical protein